MIKSLPRNSVESNLKESKATSSYNGFDFHCGEKLWLRTLNKFKIFFLCADTFGICSSLTKLALKDAKFEWTDCHRAVFGMLKSKITGNSSQEAKTEASNPGAISECVQRGVTKNLNSLSSP